MGTRRHTRAPKITLVTSSIAVTRAKRVSFSRLQTLLESKGVVFDHVDLALQDRTEEVIGLSGTRELPQVGWAERVHERKRGRSKGFEQAGSVHNMLDPHHIPRESLL
jgi:hypothetical protein